MGKAIFVMVAVVLMVYALFDLFAAPRDQVRALAKPFWFAIIVLLPIIGPGLWLATSARSSGGSTPPRGHGRPRPGGPDDDPDFLRGL